MPEKYNCKTCEKNFKSYYSCYRHENNNKCSELLFSCSRCSNRFKNNKGLLQHIKKSCKIIKETKKESKELEKLKKEREDERKEVELLRDKLNKLEEKLNNQMNNVQINDSQINQNMNIHLHIDPHRQEQLSEEVILKILMKFKTLQYHNLLLPNLFILIMKKEEMYTYRMFEVIMD
jgi:uncharacterized C2H2 Zn-finger protein